MLILDLHTIGNKLLNIRKKMGIKPGDNQYILNELGVGYRINVNIDQE